MNEKYSPFEIDLALAWAQAHLADYLRANPNASFEEKYADFSESIEGGLSVARKFTDDHRGNIDLIPDHL